MALKIECGDYTISVIGGPDDDPVDKDPFVALMEGLRKMAAPDLPSYSPHGDGITTFEVASAITGPPMQPVLLDEFRPWFIPEMSEDRYRIYGHVPVMTIMAFIIKHGGDTHPLRWLIIRNQRAFAEETRRVENLDLGDDA